MIAENIENVNGSLETQLRDLDERGLIVCQGDESPFMTTEGVAAMMSVELNDDFYAKLEIALDVRLVEVSRLTDRYMQKGISSSIAYCAALRTVLKNEIGMQMLLGQMPEAN